MQAMSADLAQPRRERDLGSALTEALSTECRLLEDLARVLERQHLAVERDDLAGVDESVFAAQRVFRTLGEARRYRRSLLELASGRSDVTLGELDTAFGSKLPRDLGLARDALRAAAGRLEGQLDRNRHLLEAALGAGDRLIRALSGSPAEPTVYARHGGAVASSGTVFLNRQI
jgi:hypothetical protein